MKKKATTYILLSLCLVIWGTIGWKVYSAMQDDIPVPVNKIPAQAIPPKDTIALLLNYRDPFLGGYSKQATQVEEPPREVAPKQEVNAGQTETEVVPDFQYKGTIRMGKTTKAIVNRNGESMLLKANGRVGEFNILRIEDSRLVVTRKNKRYELPVQ